MYLKNCIKKATQYNCCLDRKAICMKRSVTVKNAAAAKPAKSAPNVNAGINLFSQTC